MRAELPLILAAAGLAACALLLSLVPRSRPMTIAAIASAVVAAAAPLVLAPIIDPARTAGRALWEWSAAGGPTIRASYRFDGVGAIGVAVGTAYAAAGLFGAARTTQRHPLLPSAILALGLVFVALAVTEDLIAATVVLGALGAITILATLAVAPLPATTRLAAYIAVGVQFFVLAALLLARFGGPSFRFDAIVAGAVSPGVVLSGSIAAALFAGLYPFIPWRFRAQRGPELRRLRGILTMPAGVGASLLLLRLMGTTRGDITTIGLPAVPLAWRLAAALAIVAWVAFAGWRRDALPRRPIAVGGAVVLLLLAYPVLHWSHLALVAALLSVLYAAAVSLAIPEEWDVVRYDVTLAAFWVGLAIGTPTAIAGALFVLVADAAAALAEAVWSPPHRSYVIVIAGSTAMVAGLIVVGLGALSAVDGAAQGLAIAVVVAIGALVLVHVGRRLNVTTVPLGLDAMSVAAALGVSVLLALLAAVPLYRGVTETLGRQFSAAAANAPLAVTAIVAAATLLVVIGRSTRPFMPDLAPLASRLREAIAVADPVPAGLAAFAALDAAGSRAASLFAAFEQRAGVWLATILIIAVLVWSVR